MKKAYQIEGMTCTACALTIEKKMNKEVGVSSVVVNYATEKMVIEYDETILSEEAMAKDVEQIGYGLIIEQSKSNFNNRDGKVGNKYGKNHQKSVNGVVISQNQSMKYRLISSLIFTVPLFYIAMGPMIGFPLPYFLSGMTNILIVGLIQLLLTIPVMIINREFYTVGFKTLIKKAPNMDSLIAVSTSAAFVYGIYVIFQLAIGFSYGDMELVHTFSHDLYFESVAVILTLITLGKFLELRAKKKTLKAIEALMELAPEVGTVLREGKEIVLSVDDMIYGDILIIKAGEKLPLDGKVIFGQGVIDESMLTGESVPVDKQLDNICYAGTICLTGFLQIEVTKLREETTLYNIIKLVEDAQGTKAPIAKLADRISGVFVPVVLGVSLVTFIIWVIVSHSFEQAFRMAISVLVISCPCALGLATPTAIMVGTGRGASLGVLIKSGEALEVLKKADTIIFDKTGTLTQGKPEVISVELVEMNRFSVAEIVSLVVSAEEQSEHPYAKAIVKYGIESKMILEKYSVETYETVPGKGVVARINAHKVCIGNQQLMVENAIVLEDELSDLAKTGKTPLIVGIDSEYVGYILVEDVPKPEAKPVVSELKAMGLDVVMLTGDHKDTAEAIAKMLNIDTVYGEVLPDEKAEVVKSFQEQGKQVIMVGDGINDAVALTLADVGIAIGSGTDVAVESADVVLVKDSLEDVITSIDLSRSTIRNIKQNLFWAFIYNIIGIPIAAGILYPITGIQMNPMIAALAMSFSSVSVVTNALRLKSFKPKVIDEVVKTNVIKTNVIKTNVIKTNGIETKINISNPIKQMSKERKKKMKKLMIDGMTCMHCVGRVEKALKELEGVTTVEVNLKGNSALVHLSTHVSDGVLKAVVEEAGYTVTEVIEG